EGAGAATGAGADERAEFCRDSRAPSMSPLVTRPSLPVPATEDSGTPDSSEIRLADGMAGASDLGAAAGAGAGLGASAFGAAGLAAAGAEPALPSAMAPNS